MDNLDINKKENCPKPDFQNPIKESFTALFSEKISIREAKYTLILYCVYFLWSLLTAYGFGTSDPNTYTYIFGFPTWFFLSCIVAYPLCCIAVYFLIQYYFNDTREKSDEN